MKKILFSAVALLCMGAAANAQVKSDMYVGGTINASFNTSSTKTSSSSYLSGSLLGSFGYFFADNFRAEMALGFATSNNISTTTVDSYKNTHPSTTFSVRPSAAYYVKIADKLFYTPEVGASIQFGQSKSSSTMNNIKSPTVINNIFNWSVYACFAQVEYRFTSKLAVSVSLGSLSYSCDSSKLKGYTGDPTTSNYFGFSLNSGNLSIKYYL